MLTQTHLDYCLTDRQRAIVQACLDHGSERKAAEAMGCSRGTVNNITTKVKVRAAKSGWAPEHDFTTPTPDGFAVKGTSTLYDRRSGEAVLQWVKTSQDQERQLQIMQQAMEAMKEEVPRAEPTAGPRHTADDLLNSYVITDYHLGMLSWGEETGADWDTDIAEELLVRWFAAALERSPDAQMGVLAQLGDFLHWDGMDAVTPTSGHLLDADTRFQRLVRSAIRVLRRVVQMMLDKHQQVHIIMAEGNHDLASSIWLRELFAMHYEDEPRVTVETSPDPYYCIEWGRTSLFFHHGHKKKPEALAEVMAHKFREVFGRTHYSYGHSGHLHHERVIETSLMTWKQHRTLAAPDSHASRGGWGSGREATVETYSRAHGRVGFHAITPEMVKE
jgi:hypothetical protein